MRKAAIHQRLYRHFLVVAAIAILALALFGAMASRTYARLASGRVNQVIELAYTSAYALVAVAVVFALTLLYSSGLQAKTQAIALSLADRLAAPAELGIQLAELGNLEATLAEYKALNPEIDYIAIKNQDGVVAIDTTIADAAARQPNINYFTYEATLGQGSAAVELKTVLVKSPRSLLYYRLWRSVKNFLALFVASGFVAIVFLNLLRSLTSQAVPGSEEAEEQQLRIIEPFYFLPSSTA